MQDDASELNNHDSLVQVKRNANTEVDVIDMLDPPPCGVSLQKAASAYGSSIASLADVRADNPGFELSARLDNLAALQGLVDALEAFSAESGVSVD